jgi:hypothetical protein
MCTVNNTKIETFTTSKLTDLHVVKPEIQRLVDLQKIDDIVQFQLDFHKKSNFFNFTASGPINIHQWDDKYFLVDGQHRVLALERLYHEYSHDIEFYVIFVKVDSQEALEFNYNMINKNTTLPDFSHFQSIDKNIPETVASQLQLKYPTIWSKTSRARRPHLFFNYLQESLAFICQKASITCCERLETIISAFKITDGLYTKAKKTGMYLGLFPHQQEDYGYLWAKYIVEELTGITIKKSSTSSKKKIPKKIKNDSWDQYIGKKIAETQCLCCRTSKIGAKDFIAGHILSESNGGKITVDNIVPICSGCNLSMKTTNMDEFIKEHYPKNYKRFMNRNKTGGWFF